MDHHTSRWQTILLVVLTSCVVMIDGYYQQYSSKCDFDETGKRLTFLNYSHQSLRNIPLENMQDYPRFGYYGVDLSHNKLHHLTRSDLLSYQGASTVILSHNQLAAIEPGLFRGFTRLKCLDLSHNRLNLSLEMYGSLLQPLVHIEALRLEGNTDDGGSAFPSGFWSSVIHLSILSIDMYQDMMFGPEYGKLNLSVLSSGATENGCKVYRIHNDTFSVFRNSQLRELHLVNCYIWVIEIAAFTPLQNSLKVLDISFNRMGMGRAQNSLYGLRHSTMTSIAMVGINGPTSKPNNFWLTQSNTRFLSTICVENLDISMDFFSYADRIKPFGRGSCLKTLTMNAHSFHYFPKLTLFSWILAYTNLSTLDLSRPVFSYTVSGALFRTIDTGLYPESNIDLSHGSQLARKYGRRSRDIGRNESRFQKKQPTGKRKLTLPFIGSLISLNLSRIFNRVDFSGCGIHISNAEHLRNLDFSDNNLETCDTKITGLQNVDNFIIDGSKCRRLSKNFFDSFPALTRLSFRNSGLSKFMMNSDIDDVFSNLLNLREIDLAQNELTTLNSMIFDKNLALEVLDLRDNKLLRVPECFYSLKGLQSFSLAYNTISHFSKREVELFESISKNQDSGMGLKRNNKKLTIHLVGNPQQCDCDSIDFLDWIFTTDTKLDLGGNYSCTLSNSSVVYTKDLQSELRSMTIGCLSSFWLRLAIAGVVIMFIIFIAASVACRFRWNIRYWFYRWCIYDREGYHRLEAMRYKYDAFVAYSSLDLDWVEDMLMSKLENELSFKLCVHQRDFLVGEYIAHNIAQAVHKSRRVILVLSRNFLSSNWANFEIELANMKRVQEDRPNVIIAILLDPTCIMTRHISGTLKNLWDKITFLKWSESPPVQRECWERLQEVMEADN